MIAAWVPPAADIQTATDAQLQAAVDHYVEIMRAAGVDMSAADPAQLLRAARIYDAWFVALART